MKYTEGLGSIGFDNLILLSWTSEGKRGNERESAITDGSDGDEREAEAGHVKHSNTLR